MLFQISIKPSRILFILAAHCFWKNTDNLGGTCPDKFKNSTPEVREIILQIKLIEIYLPCKILEF